MTDKNSKVSRRGVLGLVGTIGAAGAFGGAGTLAFLNDREKIADNTVTAGKIDLQIDWEEHYNGKKIETQPLTNDPGPIFDLNDVKPGDHGEATISLHVYDNPAYVWLKGKLTSNAENGVNEPESKADGEDDPFGPNSGDVWSGELADKILVDLWYDGTENDEHGGNNEFDSGEVIISSGTLREVLEKLENGIQLDNQVSNGGSPPGALQNETEVTATYCGEFQGGPQEEQCIACVCEDPDVLGTPTGLKGFCYTPEGGLPEGTTHVTLKAAQECYVAEVTSSTETICLPENAQHEISNATFYRCDGGNGGNGDGCWPNSTTQYLGLSWELPDEVGNEIQTDSVSFDLKFYAEQCRHNKHPTNPWNGNDGSNSD